MNHDIAIYIMILQALNRRVCGVLYCSSFTKVLTSVSQEEREADMKSNCEALTSSARS